MMKLSTDGPRVVVGVDGSDCSREALRFAAVEARLRGLPLHVVTAYHQQVVGTAVVDVFDPHDELVTMQRQLLDESAAELAGLEVHADVVLGHPVDCLRQAGSDATLLVVGSRGHGGFTRMLLGSTSHALVQHATCPVAVVHRAPVATGIPEPRRQAGSEVVDTPLL
jgi:nucleotide-binding universal stress UspA family protein